MTKVDVDLAERVRAAAAGDRAAARDVLEAVQHDVYGLSLRMLGHPADAEDAAQEILVIVLTHLGSFRGESSLRTWVWRIAANHLKRIRRGRRETIDFETLEQRLRSGLAPAAPDPEDEALTRELRLRCTQAMLLGLDRDHRIAYVLGDIFELPGETAAEVLEIDPATFRKRLSRARHRLYAFMRSFCGVYAGENPCRCARQTAAAVERGIVVPGQLDLSGQRTRPSLARAADDIDHLLRVADVLRGPAIYLAPQTLIDKLRELVGSEQLELLRS
ncbi:MAG TPA: RNA polymerase sigma factor [Polyangiales bacterium]|nr:RNA polymerase sigma factor [Polyangiales bacterium]